MPLLNHVAFRSGSREELGRFVETQLGARILSLAEQPCGHDAVAGFRALPSSQIWFCSYRTPVTLAFPEGDCLRLQMRHAGHGLTRTRGVAVPVTEGTACLSSADAHVDFAAGYEQVVWRIPGSHIVRKLSALSDRSIETGITFDATVDLQSPAGRNLSRMMDGLASAADDLDGAAGNIMLAELEQAVVVSLLCAGRHSHRHLLERDASRVAPWQVHRAEGFIEANWDRPLRIEDIVAATGASARSVFRTFAEHRGYSPMTFLRRVRLRHARRQLASGAGDMTVTDVALRCGYRDVGRFSKDFLSAFGEQPSLTLRRARRDRPSS